MLTAKNFYNSATFFDILEQFGELEPDVNIIFLCVYFLLFIN